MLKSIEIAGLRGFASRQTIEFSQPQGTPGSGLTIVVGANNSGKSTVVEAIRASTQSQPPSFTQGRRNQAGGDEVDIILRSIDGRATQLKSKTPGSSECEYSSTNGGIERNAVLTLPSRRVFTPHFSKHVSSRLDYVNQMGFPPTRVNSVDQFTYRLFDILSKKGDFDNILSKVLNPVPDWTIDQMDSGQYFLKISKNGSNHSSEGMGEGLISLFYIIDALYDSEPGHMIAVDEPELSLHPSLQRKLALLLNDYAKDRQIVISTHSHYFTYFDYLRNGSTIYRISSSDKGSVVHQLTAETGNNLAKLLGNKNNPHIFGPNAQEILFSEDGLILFEGQEDVVFFDSVQSDLGIYPHGTIFGWGVGGAENMSIVCQFLKELGFNKVVGILDANKSDLSTELANKFKKYRFETLPADDIRSKKATKAKAAVVGLLDDSNQKVRPKFRADTVELLNRVQTYLG